MDSESCNPITPQTAPPPTKPSSRTRAGSSADKQGWGVWVLFTIYSLIIFGVGMIFGSLIKPVTGKHPPVLRSIPFYSPITPIPENRRFPLTPNMMYFGPPTEGNNAAWEYICGEDGGKVGISDKRALKNLPPSMKGGKEGEFVYEIGVCHQLHCLNHIRLALYEHSSIEHGSHLDHCVEFLREVLTCKADIAMHYWKNSNESAWDVVHQCWNFNKVVAWAREHKVTPPRGADNYVQ